MSGTSRTIQDDNLTFITYSAGWIYNNSDPHYDTSNYHATTQFGATVTLKFQGNGIEVTGATKPEYGTFSVELDGRLSLNASSLSRTPTFRRILFRLQDLPDGPHTIRIINTGSGFDVDAFTLMSLSPSTSGNMMDPMNIIIAAILAAVGVFALIIIILLLRRVLWKNNRSLYGGVSSETLVQVHPYDYVPPDGPTDRRKKFSDEHLPNESVTTLFAGSPVSVHASSTYKKSFDTSDSDHSLPSLPYTTNDTARYPSTTVTTQSSNSSTNTVILAQQPPPSAYILETPVRSVSVVRPVRPLSIAGRPGSIRQSIPPESPFDSRRICSYYATQPTIREYTKRDTIFGKRSLDQRGRVDLLAEQVPKSPPAWGTESFSPRQASRPPMNRSPSPPYAPPPRPVPDRNGPPRLTLNSTVLSSIMEPISWPESSPSLSTLRFATRPNSLATQAPSTTAPTRSNSKGESLFSPTSEKDKRWSASSKSHKEWRRSSLIPSVPPLPSVPEPEPEPTPYVPLAPPPTAARHRRAADSLGSTFSASTGTPRGAMFNSPPTKNRPMFVGGAGLPSSPRPVPVVPVVPAPQLQLQPQPPRVNADGSPPRSGRMRMVDLEAGVVGVVGIVEERRGWARVRSMMGVVGDTNKDEALFEIVAGTPLPLPSPPHGHGRVQWHGHAHRHGHRHGGRTHAPRAPPPARVGGPRVLKKPAPLALGGLSNFEPPVYGGGNGGNDGGKRFVHEHVIATGKTGTPLDADAHGSKKMSILQSAVINGRANKEEVELVTGMKMDI